MVEEKTCKNLEAEKQLANGNRLNRLENLGTEIGNGKSREAW